MIGGLLLCCVVPGCLLVEVVAGRRGRPTPFTRFMLGIGVSIVYSVVAGLILASFHLLTRSGAWAALLAPTLLLAGILAARAGRWLVSLRTAGMTPETLKGRGAAFLASLRSLTPWRIVVLFRQPRLAQTLHLLVLLALVAGPRLYVASASTFVPLQPDSWFYMADSLRLIDTQGIPTEITQWGMHTAFPPDKISFQMFTAMLMLVGRVDYLAAFKLVTLIALCVAALAVWRFAAEVVSLKVATLLTIVLFLDAQFGSGFYSNRFGETFYRAESFAVMLGFLALWLTYRGLMRREWGLLAFAPFALALAATGHGIAAFVVATVIGSLFLAKWIVQRKVEGREALALGLIALFSLAGTLLIFRVAGGAPLYQQSVTDTAAFRAYGNTDPTFALRALLDGETNPEYVLIRPKATQRFYISPAHLWDDLVRAAFPDVFHGRAGLLLTIAFFAALAAVLAAPHTPQSYRIAGVAFVLAFAAAYLLGLAFSFLYETYSPAMHPSRRVFPYLSLAVLVWGAILLQRLLDLAKVRPRQRRVWRVLGADALYLAAGVVLVLSFVRPGVQTILDAASNTDISPDGSAALAWLKQHTAPDALVLIDQRTAGAVEIMANRLSLTEGRGVDVRPDLLKRVLEILNQTAAFYQNPLDNTILREAGVDYVIVAPAHDIGGWEDYSPGTESSLALCQAAPFLTQVAQFGEVYIFEVDPAALTERAIEGVMPTMATGI